MRALPEIVACDIHPIDNLRVLRYLTRTLWPDEADIGGWYNHWIDAAFRPSNRCSPPTPVPGLFVMAVAGLAEVALVPQVVNAERYRLDMAPYPTIARIFGRCMELAPFEAAHPDNQPDREA